MALSNQEISEIGELPELLREKIFRVFNSPLYNDRDALDTFITNKMNELKENNFSIIFTDNPDKELPVEKMVQKAMSARQESETALKYAKELPSLRQECEKLRKMLTEEEQELAANKKTTKSKTVAI